MMSGTSENEEKIFAAVVQLPEEQRATYLDQACAGDTGLRQRIERLLAALGRASPLLREPASSLQPPGITILPAEKAGERIGRYKLLEQIGEGGCGVVYVAEQEEPVRRRVALKIIKLGMDTKQVIARFEAERQALAIMDHPNIAKVFDAGSTETGRPFFVLELVRGVKITDYCDNNRLSPHERLELFVQVCRAIQHAHQKGIIHRDIKPSNILVTVNDGEPVPKVIDFGIAKATQGRLTDHTVYTAFEQFIGTPAYMSPEQAGMTSLDIDTRSDIYSLGVLLYELLTGSTPFDQRELLATGLDAMRRTIKEVEPPKPSTRLSTMGVSELTSAANRRHTEPPKLIHAVRGDLDWIVMKCLEKDRARRYETANGLATDIQRHLGNEPVAARPPSKLYRFQKSIQRNKLAFAAAVAVMVALLLGLAAAQIQKRKAQIEAAKNRETAEFLKKMLEGIGPSVALGRDTTMLREIVDQTSVRLATGLKGQPEVETDLLITLAQVYLEMQLFKPAEENASKALQISRSISGGENLFAAHASRLIGQVHFRLRDIDQAEPLIRKSIAMYRKLLGPESADEAAALANLSDVLRHKANRTTRADLATEYLRESEAAIRKSLAIHQRIFGNESDEAAWSLVTMNLVISTSRPAEAENGLRKALEVFRKNHGEDHPATIYTARQLALTISRQDEQLATAEEILKKLLKARTRIEGERRAYHHYDYHDLADVLEREGKLAEAAENFQIAVDIVRTQIGADNPDLVNELVSLSNVLRKLGKLGEARASAEEAVDLCRRLPQRVERWAEDRAFQVLKAILTDLQDTPALEALKQKRFEQLQLAAARGDTSAQNSVAWFLATNPNPLLRNGTNALRLAEQVVASTERKNPQYLDTLAAAYAELGDFERAIKTQKEAISLVSKDEAEHTYVSRLKLYEANQPARE